MPRTIELYNQVEQKRVQVTTAEADKLLRDPAYLVLDNQEFTVVDGWGQKFAAAGPELYKHLQDSDFRLETEEEEHQRYLDENYGGVGGAAAAGVLGAARGVTLGISDLAAEAVGFGDTVADIAEASPGISTAAEIAGGVAGALATGGAGAAARGVVGRTVGNVLVKTPAALAVRGGNAAAHAVEAALKAGTSLDKGAVLLGRAAGMAAEGAAFGGGAAVSERLLGDPDAAASDILADWASGATEGAAFGGVLGFAFGLPALAKRGNKLLEAANKPAVEGTDESLRAMMSEVTGREIGTESIGVWRETINKVNLAVTKMKHGRSSPAQVEAFERMVRDPVERAAATLEKGVERAADDVLPKLKEADGLFRQAVESGVETKTSRVGVIAKEVVDMSDAAAVNRFKRPMSALRGSLQSVIDETVEIGDRTVSSKLRKFTVELEKLEAEYADDLLRKGQPRGGEAAFEYLDKAGTLINKRLREWRRLKQFADNPPSYIRPVEQARAELLGSLMDDAAFGAGAAGKMRELRQAADRALKYRSMVDRKLKTKTVSDTLGDVYEFDIAKVRTLLGKFQKDGEQSIDVRNLLEYVRGARSQLQTNRSLGAVLPENAGAYTKAEKALDDLLERFDNWEKVYKIRGDYQALSKLSGFEGLKGPKSIFRQASGLGLLGLSEVASPGAAVGMWMVGAAAGTLQKPAQYIRSLEQLHSSRGRVSEAIRGSVKSMFSGTGSVAGAALRIAPMQAIGGRDRRDTETLHTALEGLSEVSAAGEGAVGALQNGFGPVRGIAPQTTVAMAQTQRKAAEYLTRKAAQLGVMPAPGSFRKPSAAAEAKFWRAFDMTNDPMTHIVQPLARGVFDAQAAEVLQEVYPPLLEGIKSVVWEEMQDAPFVDASTARRVSRILGIPHPSAMQPDTVRVVQNAGTVLNPPESPNVAGSGRPAGAETTLTAAQRLENK